MGDQCHVHLTDDELDGDTHKERSEGNSRKVKWVLRVRNHNGINKYSEMRDKSRFI